MSTDLKLVPHAQAQRAKIPALGTALTLALGLALALGLNNPAWAQAVALSGILGEKALLVIDGAAPSLLAVGSSQGGVKVVALNTTEQTITIEAAGLRRNLRVGDSPVSVGGKISQGGRFITIPAGKDGHFFTSGFINGRSTQFMVDTGASAVVLGRAEAERLGLDFKKIPSSVKVSTANGITSAQPIRLQKLRVGEVELLNVEAIIGPDLPFVLLGNSFLSHFKMERSNDMMRLERTR